MASLSNPPLSFGAKLGLMLPGNFPGRTKANERTRVVGGLERPNTLAEALLKMIEQTPKPQPAPGRVDVYA